jgi:hypothetical protein
MFLANSHLLFETFFLLLFGHFLADFPLQGEYLSRTKDPTQNEFGIWFISMFAHSMIHAGIVFVLTGSTALAGLMLITHFFIDYAKCQGWFGTGQIGYVRDQMFHYLILFLIAVVYCSGI